MMSVDLRSGEIILELCALDGLKRPPAEITEKPEWGRVDLALKSAFENGGFVVLKVLSPKDSVVRELSMKSLPRQYRLVALIRSSDPKAELQEWWEPGDSVFRGFVRFGDDDWDSRTVCSDIFVAQGIFRELFNCGDLPAGLLQMRSQWNPKP